MEVTTIPHKRWKIVIEQFWALKKRTANANCCHKLYPFPLQAIPYNLNSTNMRIVCALLWLCAFYLLLLQHFQDMCFVTSGTNAATIIVIRFCRCFFFFCLSCFAYNRFIDKPAFRVTPCAVFVLCNSSK